jgi:hypothetical protein
MVATALKWYYIIVVVQLLLIVSLFDNYVQIFESFRFILVGILSLILVLSSVVRIVYAVREQNYKKAVSPLIILTFMSFVLVVLHAFTKIII